MKMLREIIKNDIKTKPMKILSRTCLHGVLPPNLSLRESKHERELEGGQDFSSENSYGEKVAKI